MNGPVDHIPVLRDTVVEMLVREEDGIYLDGTIGLGGHAAAILDCAGPGSRLLGVDLDPSCVATARRRVAAFGERAVVLQGDYTALPALARERHLVPVDGIVLDLGISSWLIESSGRGFSFQKDEPLDMRFDPTQGQRAEDILNLESERHLTRILREYGEEPLAARLARAIVSRRKRSPLRSTMDLRTLVTEIAPRSRVNKTLARVFQSIRIAVNNELGKLRDALPKLVDILRPSGRLAVISFHSLEDRVTKTTFRRLSGECVCPPRLPVCGCHPVRRLRLVTGAVRPDKDEVSANPRARSAVLRVVARMPEANGAGEQTLGGTR
ncbi:MAG: 16S rRNA (cytosine(1402)-N(4))-methyltransferase RsmH [Candidatus Eisenbacteria sp.]|nr:16S rRNA (cytosine(1402)-N(4))-methyltransferase RsmH [Candidatus Eisenbacteria bacterium]